MTRGLRDQAGPLLLIAGLAVVWTWPLVCHLTTHVTGLPGDNYSFLWNLWWMRHVFADGGGFFHSTFLFAPFGVDLINHPHTALQGAIGATVLAKLSIIEAENVYVLVSVFLNAAMAYALAVDITGDHRGGMLAAVTFGGSPFVFAHLLGHFDLLTMWPIPLFALCLKRALGKGSITAAAGCGVALAVAAYSAYYFVVYIGLMACAYMVAWSGMVSCPIERRVQSPAVRIVRAVLVTLLVLDAALIAWLLAADGGGFTIAGIDVSVRGVRNPLTVAWVLMALTLLTWWRLPVRIQPPPAGKLGAMARTMAVTAVVFSIVSAPLIVEGVRLARAGRYVSQTYFWRSAPRGVDLVTLVAGNPFQPVIAPLARRIYAAFGIDRIENAAWLGIVPLILLWGPRGRWQDAEQARCWLAVLAAGFIWALGPFAIVAGHDIGLPLPETLMRFLPVVSNARVPGRAMVIAYLALGLLGALRLPELEGRWRRPVWQWVIVAAVFVEFLGAPIPLTELEAPAVYAQLAQIRDNGAVCEVPFGIGDGLTEGIGSQERRVLYYATIHGHPLVGGYIGRMPPGVTDEYERMPFVGNLLKLSSGRPAVPDRPGPQPCRYVVVDRAKASPELQAYVQSALRLDLLAASDGRDLYRVR
jgi:hypothetical protein